MRGGGEQRRYRRAAMMRFDLRGGRKLEIGIGAVQMRERVRHRGARLAVGQNGGHFKLRMTGDQAQKFAGHVTGAAEHDRRRGCAHSPATLDSRTLRSPERCDDVVTEIRRMADGIEGLDIHLLADDFDSHLIVGRGSGDHARFDAESFAQQFDAAPGGDRIVRRQHHGGQRRLDVGLAQDGFDAIGSEQAVAQFEDDGIRTGRRPFPSAWCGSAPDRISRWWSRSLDR